MVTPIKKLLDILNQPELVALRQEEARRQTWSKGTIPYPEMKKDDIIH